MMSIIASPTQIPHVTSELYHDHNVFSIPYTMHQSNLQDDVGAFRRSLLPSAEYDHVGCFKNELDGRDFHFMTWSSNMTAAVRWSREW